MATEPTTTAYPRIRRGLASIALIGLVAIAALMLVPPLLGLERYVVTGRSMTGSIDDGSIVFDEPVPVSELRIGDVITYVPPPSAPLRTRVTHRIVWVGHDRTGRRAFQTKGDFNHARDPWKFTLTGPRQARVVFHVPAAGYVIAALSLRPVRIVVIGIPALLVAFAVFGGLWREAGEHPVTEPAT